LGPALMQNNKPKSLCFQGTSLEVRARQLIYLIYGRSSASLLNFNCHRGIVG
jgi:hypothetical protein